MLTRFFILKNLKSRLCLLINKNNNTMLQNSSMFEDCASLSKKEINNSFSARKKKRKVLKNVLLPSKPQLFKCIRTASDKFNSLLINMLPCARISNLINASKEACKAARNSLCLGVNAVNRELQKKNISAVLFTADVNPEALVSHLIQRCCHYDVPTLKVNNFRNITSTTLGFECIALGFKKSCDVFQDLIKLTYVENNKVMTAEVSFNYASNDTNNMQVEEKVCNEEGYISEGANSVIFLEEKQQERIFEYFKRIEDSNRIFSPEKYNIEHGLLHKECYSDNGFISIQNQTFCIDDTAKQGISSSFLNNDLKRCAVGNKQQKFKKYVPATVKKLGNNINRKKKRQN